MTRQMRVCGRTEWALFGVAAGMLLACAPAGAANVIKLDTASLVADASNWSAAPGASDVGEFDATCSAGNLSLLTLGGANLTLGGLQFDNTMAGPATILSGNTLTLGTSGINMSGANQNVTVNCGIGIGGNQTWNVGAGRALAFATGVGASGASARIVTKSGDGALSLNGTINFQSNGGGEGFLVNGGSVTATGLIIGRNAYPASVSSIGVPSAAAATGSGFYVNGVNTVVSFTSPSTTSYVGYQNSGATMRIDGGCVTMAGPLVLGRMTGTGRYSHFQVNGGAFTNANAAGLQLSPNYNSVANKAVLYLTGGVTAFEKIGFGALADTLGGDGYVTLAGGTLYLGSGGIVRNTTVGAYNAKICLNSGTLGAKANWSTSLGATLNGTVTIRAADAAGLARDIMLAGDISTISGTGAIIKTGDGMLVLAGTNSYAGSTTISVGTVQVGNGGASGTLGTADASGIAVAGTLAFKRSDDVTYAGVISGAGALAQRGGGSLSLTQANTYEGGTTVSAGRLLANNASGSATGTGAVTLQGGLLGGTGSVGGAVTANAGGGLAPGGSVGTLTVSALTLNDGATNSFEFSATPANDQALVTTSDGLVLNGGAFGLYAEGGSAAWTTPGTYNLIQYSGALSGSGTDGSGNLNGDWTTSDAFNPHIANPEPGLSYAFGVSGGWLTLTITSDASVNKGTWTGSSDGNWSDAGNWTAESGTMPPRNARDSATLGTGAALRTVTLDANESVGSLLFNNANSFVIANGGYTLTLDKAGTGADLDVTGGTTNVIQTAVSLNDNVAVSVTNGASLAITGTVGNTGDSKTLNVSGAGTLALSGNNAYGPAAGSVGTVLSGGGIVQVGHNSALGAGDVSVDESYTLRAGAAGLTVTNNIGVAAGAVATVDSAGSNLTLGGLISGAGALAKSGDGVLTINTTNAYVGGTVIGGGVVSLATTRAGSLGLGSGAVAITNNARLALYTADGNDPGDAYASTFANNLVVQAGQTASIWHSARGTLSGTLTGGGTLNLRVNYVRGDISGNWSGFSGQVNVSSRDTDDSLRFNNGNLGLPLASVYLGNEVDMYLYNHFYGSCSFAIGTLAGATNSTLASGSDVGGRICTYQVGARNEDSVFAGRIADSTGATALTKVGTGTLTLTWTNNTYTGATAVNLGALRVDGVITGSVVTVSAGARLSGSGTLGGLVALASGAAAISQTNGVAETLTLAGGLTLNAGNVLALDVGAEADVIAVTGGTFTRNGTVTVSLNVLQGYTGGTRSLVTGIGITDATGFVLSGVPPELKVRLVASDGDLLLKSTAGTTLMVQ
jgi:autotransporter-associated beta strand protein